MKSNDARRIVLAVLVAAVAAVPAPASAALVRPIRFEHLSLEEGLSQAAVMKVVQDRRGYIWLATEDGLNRYDGTGFRVYRHDATDPASLPDNFIWDVEEDAQGSVWIATRGGLCRWDRATDQIVRQDTPGVRNIRVLRYQAKANSLWIGTRESGILRLDLATGTMQRFAHAEGDKDSLADDRIYALYVDGKDRLWVGTEAGLDLLKADGRGFTHQLRTAADGSAAGTTRVRAILADDMGALWVGTAGGGLNRLDLARGSVQRFRHDAAVATSMASDDVRALLQDSAGRLWVGTAEGLDLYDHERGTFAHYRNDPRNLGSLADNHVLSLAQDRGGVIWVGTRMGGVHKWNPLSWQFGHVAPDPDNPRGLGGGKVTALAEDRAGGLWIGTYGAGLYAMDRASGDMKAYRYDAKDPRSLPSDTVTALRHDYQNNVWIGTVDAGLVRLERASGAFKSYPHDPKNPEGLSARGVTAILEDPERRLWIGTYGGGLERFDPDTEEFVHHRHDPKDDSSISGDRVAAIVEAGDGRLWVGTMETGLNLLDPRTGRFERFNHRADDPSSLPSDAIHGLHVDVAGTLWVGTHSGLSQMQPDGRSFKTWNTRNGLSSDVIYAIANDRHGRLWLSTNSGLSVFNLRGEQFVNYGISNGLQAREFNFGAWYQSTSGELFFGGLNGFNAFVPDRIRQLAQAPEVVLTGVNVDHRPLGGAPPDETRGIKLGFRDKVLSLDFAALEFTAPHRNAFSYKLEGFDPEWVSLSGKGHVTYTNLNPGRYTFLLRGANSDGRWNEKALAVPVDVAAPPWATPSAYAGYSLCLIGAVLAGVRQQKRKFAREAEYARILEFRVQERTRELSARQADLEKANDELARASITDSLTGLANRRFLTEYIEKEVALLHRRYNRLSESPITADLLDMAFVMIDVDHFKTINDSAGHAAGDNVLRQLRDLLVACSRSSDIIVRWGGDEFLLVARDLSGDGLIELAERVRTRVAQHVFDIGEGRVVRTTCSIGFACYPFFREQLDALSWEQVISVADRALYVAKASGRNAWVGFQPGITALPIQGLFSAVCHGAQNLVREGTLRVISSLTGVRNLVWDVVDHEKDKAARA
jgi:diguanylate cyclase (GGDEF)-like protein